MYTNAYDILSCRIPQTGCTGKFSVHIWFHVYYQVRMHYFFQVFAVHYWLNP
jgi:hypothetical protein